MKIVRVINELRQGGVQIRLVRVAKDLAARGHEVVVVCTEAAGENAPELEASGVCVVEMPMPAWDDKRYWLRLAKFFRAERPDVVHSHLFRQNVPATIAARMARVPKVFAQVHLVQTYRRSSWIWTDRILAARRTAMLAVSEAVANDIREALKPFPVPRLVVLYNGVQVEKFRGFDRNEVRRRVRSEFGMPPGALVLINVARLHKEKNHPLLLQTFAHLAPKHPRAHLLIVGSGDSEEKLREFAVQLGIRNRVTFAGDRKDVPELLNASDALVLPSKQEGFSNAILEAMASGLPVVATDTGGAREIVRDGRNGYVVGVREYRGLRDAMARVMEDAPLRLAMSHNNLADVLEYRHERMIDRTEELYRG